MDAKTADGRTTTGTQSDLSFTVTLYHPNEVTDSAVEFTINQIEATANSGFSVTGAKRESLTEVDIHVTSEFEFGSVAATNVVDTALRNVVTAMTYTSPGPLSENHQFTHISVDYDVQHKIGKQ